MDDLRLIAEARAAGLTVNAVDGRLVVRGPRRAEATARRLVERKAEMMAALAGDAAETKTTGAQGRPSRKPCPT